MAKLIIIGNGFDLHTFSNLSNPKMDTSYKSYYEFLSSLGDYTNIHRFFPKLFAEFIYNRYDGLEAKNGMWWNFEEALSTIDGTFIVENIDNGIQDYIEEANSRGYDLDFLDMCTKHVGDTTTFQLEELLGKNLKLWINSINEMIPTSSKRLSNTAYYINFNYTDTLQKYYNVSDERILHIHGSAKNVDELMMGHGEKLTEILGECFYEVNYYGLKTIKYDISKYKIHFIKDVTNNICKLHEIDDIFRKIDEVFVIGHSLGGVDIPYFDYISSKLDLGVVWNFGYYNEKDVDLFDKINNFCMKNRITLYSRKNNATLIEKLLIL